MSNISFGGNPQQAATAVGGTLALLGKAGLAILSGPALPIIAGAAAIGGAAYAFKKANEKKKK